MPHRVRELAVVVACAVAAIGGCGGQTAAHKEPLLAIVSPAIPAAAQEIANALRGQYEGLLLPLFPRRDPAQRRYPAWPKTYDAGIRVSWRQLQPTDPRMLAPDAPDDQKYDFSAIDDTLAKLVGSRGHSFGVWLKWAKTDAGEVGQISGGSKPHCDLTRAATPDFRVPDGPESGP